ncbi:unnamed protein product [Strongylus vulgaris]|uniref:Uncharacterized protein n=1 Tax=Strongylus vulgaris TaxID=40348 RepID=A0A3P7I1E4_STRVU|nr:unnamed protein product [Strongylus vulgaris]
MPHAESYSVRYPRTEKSVPSYDELYLPASTSQKSLLKAYDIDLSVRDGALSTAPTQMEYICAFDGTYKTRRSYVAKLDLPLIVKPLRQYGRECTPREKYRSDENSSVDVHSNCAVAPLICRRRTLNGVDDMRGKWYSSSVDGALESSTLPKNFLRKPSILHAAAPVKVQVIPDDDLQASTPPPKPARNFTQLDALSEGRRDSEPESASELFICTAKPVLAMNVISAASMNEDAEHPEFAHLTSVKNSFGKSSYKQNTTEVTTTKFTPKRHTRSLLASCEKKTETKRQLMHEENTHKVLHYCKNDVYQSDLKEYEKTVSLVPKALSDPKGASEFFDETQSDSDNDLERGEDPANRFAISRATVEGKTSRTSKF